MNAADITATLDSADGSSGFSFRDSGNVQIGIIDSDGNLEISGNMGIGVTNPGLELHIKDTAGSAYMVLDGWSGGNDGSIIELRKQDDPSNNRTLLSRLFSTHGSVADHFRIDHRVGGVQVGLLSFQDDGNLAYAGRNVGIGISSPLETLEVSGAIKLGTTAAANNGTIRYTGTDFEARKAGAWVSLTQGGDYMDGGEAGGADRSLGNTDSFALSFKTNNITRLHIKGNGYVGAGSTNPQTTLEVAGRLSVIEGNRYWSVGCGRADGGG